MRTAPHLVYETRKIAREIQQTLWGSIIFRRISERVGEACAPALLEKRFHVEAEGDPLL